MRRRSALACPLLFTALGAHAAADKVQRDVPYGTDKRQRFDVYLPEKPTGPVILMVHGGAWVAGDKANPGVVANKVKHWQALGYVLVSTNYRLVPQAGPLEQAADVARALAKVQQLAAGWGADPQRIVLMGHSSGGHLVTLLNSATGLAKAQGAQAWKATVTLDSAAMNVVELMEGPHPKLYDRAFGADPAYWKQVSPWHVLGPGAAPILMVCSSRRKESFDEALALERKAAKLHQQVTIWTQNLSNEEVSSTLGLPGIYTDSVTRWISSIL